MKIIFDFDGTLSDMSERHYRVYSEGIRELGGQLLSQEEYWALKRENISWPEILAKSRVDADKLPAFMRSFIPKMESEPYLKLDKLFPDAKKTLDDLQANKLYLLSLRRSNETLTDQLGWLGIKDKFTKILSGHTEGAGSELKEELIKSVSPNKNDFVIGDTEADILMAKKLGLISVAVTSGIRSRSFLEKLQPDYLIDGVGGLPAILSAVAG